MSEKVYPNEESAYKIHKRILHYSSFMLGYKSNINTNIYTYW
jgi:hypothetical protein